MNPDEEIPQNSPLRVDEAEPASTQDESDFSTLTHVLTYLDKAIKDIRSIDVFELDEGEATIKEQLVGYKKALDIIEPLRDTVKSTVDAIKVKQGRTS